MKNSIWFLTGICLFSQLACSPITKDIQLVSVSDPNVQFSQIKTYSWVGVMTSLTDAHGQWAPRKLDVYSEIKWLVDREMRERGLFEVKENPDIGLVVALAVDMDIFEEIDDPESDVVGFENIPQGALFAALVDPDSLYALWVGAATADILANPNMETTRKRLDYGISKIFRAFP